MQPDKDDLFFDPEDTVIDVASTSSKHLKKRLDEVDLLEDGELVSQGSDFQSSSVSLLKTILGAGLLAMPAAMASVGWVFGSIFIGVSAGLALFGLVLLTECCERLGRGSSIAAIAKLTYPRTAKIIDVALALKCFGVAVSYLIVIGDMMPSIAIAFDATSDLLRSRNFWVVASIFIVGPLAFLRNLESLKYTSLAGLGAVLYMVVIAIMNWYQQIDIELPPGLEPVPFAGFSISALRNFSIFIFAFTAHQNICTIQNEAVYPTSSFMRRIINWSIAISAAAYFLFSVFAYATYGSSTESNVFLNFPAFKLEMIFGRLLYTLLSAFSYPLLTHPCRASILNLLPLPDETKLRHFGTIHRVTTSVIVVGTLVVALMLRDLGIISALIGTFIGIPICYIVPGLFYGKLMVSEEQATKKRRLGYGMVIFGILAMIISAVAICIPDDGR